MKYLSACKHLLHELSDTIHEDDFCTRYRVKNAFTRNSGISFVQMIYFLLSMSKKSIPCNILDFRDFVPSLKFPNVSRQAVSKARRGINPLAFKALFMMTVSSFYEKVTSPKLWNGHLVFAVDGSTIQVPNTPENQSVFGINPNQHGGSGALASASMLVDIMSGLIVDTMIDPYKKNEREAFLKHLQTVDTLKLKRPIIFMGDRGYPSIKIFQELISRNHYFVIRVSKSYRRVVQQSENDCYHIFKDPKTKDKIRVRGIKVLLPNGDTEYLITNITDNHITSQKFGELYHLRWGIETKYRELKRQLELEQFTGIKAIAVKQDFYIAALISNICAMIKLEADETIEANAKSENKHEYQASRPLIISSVKRILTKLLLFKSRTFKRLKEITGDAVKVKSIIRPDRSFSRKKGRIKSVRKFENNHKRCM